MTEKKIEYPGLSQKEASEALARYGRNTLDQKKEFTLLFLLFNKIKSPFMLLLIGISIVSFFLGQKASASMMLAMVFISIFLDFYNSYKSNRVVEELVAKVAIKATVIRDRAARKILSSNIVPGDIALVAAGDVIPADGEVLACDDFFVNQAALTGESIPVEKIAADKNKTGDETFSRVLMGTSVVTGFATIRVAKTGAKTEFGKIAEHLKATEPKTDFEISITKFSMFIMRVIFYMVLFVCVVYMAKNISHITQNIFIETLTFALAITIGVTPDMLPAIITMCLSKGSKRMAEKNVIVKHLATIENFGSMDVLCTDKTGTLTEDKIALVKYMNCRGNETQKVLDYGYLSSHFHTGVQNPLDSAIVGHHGVSPLHFEKIDEIPYDFERKRSSMVVRGNGEKMLITKGAPEEIIKICSCYEIGAECIADATMKTMIAAKFQQLSREGFRVLGLAYKKLENDSTTTYKADVERDMIFLGFLAFLDPPKKDVGKTIAALKNLAVDVKILTGDSELLTTKICGEIGFGITGIVLGSEIDALDDLALQRKIESANIFARVNPLQKERIILSLQKLGKCVGYLGDGINDAPSLKAADVGISVDNAVSIARETADIILLKKSLDSLKEGIIEGRKTFRNTLKYLLMGLSSNFGNMFSMMGASIFLPFLPMLPTQVLFNNLIYDISQFSLPSDSVDEDALKQPTHWDIRFIRKYMIVFGLISSIFDFLTFFLLYFLYHLGEHAFQTGWFIESIATQIFVIYVIRTKKIPFFQSSPSRWLLATTVAAVVFCWIVPFTGIGALLNFEPLPATIMIAIALYVGIYLVAVELVKNYFYKKIKSA